MDRERIERTHQLLDREGVSLRERNPKFVEYWVKQGKTPEDIVELAIGRRPDSHLGGVEK